MVNNLPYDLSQGFAQDEKGGCRWFFEGFRGEWRGWCVGIVVGYLREVAQVDVGWSSAFM